MGLANVPRVLWGGLIDWLHDIHRYGLCCTIVVFPLYGLTYLLNDPLLRAYLDHPVAVGIVTACVVLMSIGLMVGGIVKGMADRLQGGTPDLVDMIEAMFARPFTRAALVLLATGSALVLLFGVYACLRNVEESVLFSAYGGVLLLVLCVFAMPTAVAILERCGPWLSIRRCLALMRGRMWFTLACLIGAAAMAWSVKAGLAYAYLLAIGSEVYGWHEVIITLVAGTSAASMGAAIAHRLRELEASRSQQSLANHFD